MGSFALSMLSPWSPFECRVDTIVHIERSSADVGARSDRALTRNKHHLTVMIVSARLIVYRSEFGSKGVASVTTPPRTLLVMDPATFALQFSPSERARLASVADLIATEASADFDVAQLAEAEVLITSWGCPPITDTVLDAAPRLRAIIHA